MSRQYVRDSCPYCHYSKLRQWHGIEIGEPIIECSECKKIS